MHHSFWIMYDIMSRAIGKSDSHHPVLDSNIATNANIIYDSDA